MESGQASVPTTDRAFLYGDGVFETLLIVGGVPLWLDLHIARLKLGASRLRMDVNIADVQACVASACECYRDTAGVLRVTISRGGAERGYTPSQDVSARVRSSHAALGRDPFIALPAAVVATSSITMGEQPLLAGLKHCNRLEQVMAAAEAQERNIDDVLLRRLDGSYQCSSKANLFALNEGLLRTSPCDRSGIAGTRRHLIMQTLAQRLGLQVTETSLSSDDLLSADGLFLCNSIVGIRNIKRWDEHDYDPSKVISQLQSAYYQEARQCCGM